MPESIFTGTPRLSEWQRQLIGMVPYVGPLYSGARGINAIAQFINHLSQGGGPQLPTNSETNNPPMYGSGDTGPIAGPQLPTNSETNNPPMYGSGQPPPASNLGPGGIPLSVWQQVYNSGRFTNAPAFSPSLQQAEFPGSRIGPGGTSVANPYNVNATHGTPNPVFTGLSGPAVDAAAEIARRNIK